MRIGNIKIVFSEDKAFMNQVAKECIKKSFHEFCDTLNIVESDLTLDECEKLNHAARLILEVISDDHREDD